MRVLCWHALLLCRAKSSSSAGEASSSSSSPQQQDQQWDPATAGVTHAIGIGCGKRDDLRKVWQQRQLQRASGADAAGARRGKQPRVPRISAECEVRLAAHDMYAVDRCCLPSRVMTQSTKQCDDTHSPGLQNRSSKPTLLIWRTARPVLWCNTRLSSSACGIVLVFFLQVYVSQLSTQDENLVIAAEGLIQVSPPKEIATLLQHFSAGSLMDSKRALCAIKEQQMEIRKQQEEADAAAGRVSSAGRSAKRKAAGASEAEVNPLAEVQMCSWKLALLTAYMLRGSIALQPASC